MHSLYDPKLKIKMALTNGYLQTTKNLPAFLNAIVTAQAPERFSHKFLQELEFKSTNDRLFIGVLKGLGFIDDAGVPQQRYFDFLDQSQSKRILASAVREAYDDLFRINKTSQELSEDEVKGKLKTLTRGEKSETVIGLMAKTFRGLCEYADWTGEATKAVIDESKSTPTASPKPEAFTPDHSETSDHVRLKAAGLHYNIQIHLPATRDSSVYDAIFKSLREHLIS
jgi:hypothetical protein